MQPSRSVARRLFQGLLVAGVVLVGVELCLWGVASALQLDWTVDPLPSHRDYQVICPVGDELISLCAEDGLGYERVRPEMFFGTADRPRVVAIGESFVHGYQLEREQAWPARLEQQLGGEVEVLNLGRCGSFASKLVPVVEAAVTIGADVAVLAMGNNEHTMSSFFTGLPGRHPLVFYRLSGALGRLRIYGLLTQLTGRELRVSELEDGMPRVFGNELDELVYAVRRRPPDLRRFEGGYASPRVTRILEREQRLKERIFEQRLDSMVRTLQEADVRVILATLPHDLSEAPVLSGIHRGDPARVAVLAGQLERMQRERSDELGATIDEALDEEPRFAAFLHARGAWLLDQGRDAEAAEAFRGAIEWDLVPDATRSINSIIASVARQRACALVDLDALSDEHMRNGRSFFRDKVHVSAAGADEVAAAIAPVLEAQVAARGAP